MRIYLFLSLFLISGFFLVNGPKVEAQTSSTTTSSASSTNRVSETVVASSTPRLGERLASSTERQEERQALRNQRQAALSVERQQRVLNLSANLSNRFDAVIERFYNIINRLEARITKLNAAGFDTNAATEELRMAAQHLADAKSTLATIDTLVQDATTSTEPQNRWVNVRATYQKAGISIRAAHQSLKNTVSLLKSAGQNRVSTTTPETTATSTNTQ